MTVSVETEVHLHRTIGLHVGNLPGPTVICVGGMHGNEHAAVIALYHVSRLLDAVRPHFRGKFISVCGNMNALSRNQRYLSEDLNRIWVRERIEKLRANSNVAPADTPEAEEQRQIFAVLQPHLRSEYPVYALDLHTTSAESYPFTIIQDKPTNRDFALNFHAPMILGLLDHLHGSLIQYLEDVEGCHTLAFEAGQHDDERSIHRHIAAIWIALVSAGCLSTGDVPDPDYEDYQDYLRESLRHVPKVFEVSYRYAIQPEERFVMQPGFVNFQPIDSGQLLAHSDTRPVINHRDGNIFMPLYQSQGDDGYFIIRKIEGY